MIDPPNLKALGCAIAVIGTVVVGGIAAFLAIYLTGHRKDHQ